MGKGPTKLLIAFEDALIKDLGAHVFEYTERDSILYNLGLGCKWDEPRYVYENDSQFGVLPTFPVIPPFHGVLSELPLQDILPNFNPVGTTVASAMYRVLKHSPSCDLATASPDSDRCNPMCCFLLV